MFFRCLLICGLLLLGLSRSVLAAPTESRLEQLAADPFWLALGHYEPTRFGGWRSHVDDAEFFLSAAGATHPLAELQATLSGFRQSPALADRHPQCRYPARLRWLQARLDLADLPDVDCPAWQAWLQEMQPGSAVLIFPSAYLNSPSSIFGHTLLRIDPPGFDPQSNPMLSQAVNFGASIDDADSGMLYAWKGLMGGYPGRFAIMPYFQKLKEYNRLENRDLWEYQLNLTRVETLRMVEHLWEVQRVSFDYYFFDENCSYRVLELLEIARPGLKITEDFQLTAIPVDTVRGVEEAGLVAEVRFRPSRERELLVRVRDLDAEAANWVERLATEGSTLDSAGFRALPAARQARLVDAAYRLLRFRANGQDRDPGQATLSYRLLQAMNRNPPAPVELSRPEQPETGHLSRRLSLIAGSREDRAYTELGLRMAYHDLNDPLQSFPLGAEIEIAELALRGYEGDHWQLQSLTLAGIRSLIPRESLLDPWSWQVSGGLQRVPGRRDDEVLAAYVSGGRGVTHAWGGDRNLLSFALLTGRLEHNPDHAARLSPALGFDLGGLWAHDWGQTRLELEGDYFHNGEIRRRLQAVHQFDLGRNLGLRLGLVREHSKFSEPTTDLQLGLRWHFY